MNEIIEVKNINGKEIPAITSLQIAEDLEKLHRHVMRDIRNIMEKCSPSFNESNFGLVEYTDSKGEKRPMYLLSKDACVMVTMGYTDPKSMQRKEAYIARFNEMEDQLRNPFAAMLPKNFPEALRALAKSEEEKEVLKIERDKAIRAKGQISSSREAKALNMLSQQSKKIKKLEDQIGIGETYKTLKAIPWIGDVFVPSKGMFSQVGKALTKTSNKMGLPVRKIDTPEYPGGVNAYYVDVVSELYDELFRNPALLSKYRVY